MRTNPPHVAILLPSRGQRALANLARDAIAAFTADVSHEVWSLDHQGATDWPWGSEANGLSLDTMLDAIKGFYVVQRASHVFAMHDDALPLRVGWLSYLLSKPGPVTGVKASQRNGYAHASGVLFTREFAVTHSMRPSLPERDAAEWPPAWCATATCWRPSVWRRFGRSADHWWQRFSCDVSFDDDSKPFYIHRGGGTINRHQNNTVWIREARKALGL